MAKYTITGMREFSFTDRETGQLVEGMSVYYHQPLEPENGLQAAGYTTGKLSVKPGTELYNKMKLANYSKPFVAELVFDIMPNARRAVLADIQF